MNFTKGTGITFENWTQGFALDDDFCFLHVLAMLFVNNFVHIVLTCYFESVMPSDFGMTRPWYFPVQWLLPENGVFSALKGGKLVEDTEPLFKDTDPFSNSLEGKMKQDRDGKSPFNLNFNPNYSAPSKNQIFRNFFLNS